MRDYPFWLRVSGASAFVIAVFLLSLALGFPQQGARFLLLYPAVFACAYFAGREAGIAATVAGAIAATAYIVRTWTGDGTLAVTIGALFLFLFIGFATSILLAQLKRSFRALEAAHDRLQLAHNAAREAERTSDLLLRELRHRTKNDLANLIAILRMQAARADGHAADQLNAAAERLHVVSKIHRRLSREGHNPVVEMSEFLSDLCADYRTTLLSLRPVALNCEVEPLRLPIGRALPLALIVNELLTNAIKYAFGPEGEGRIDVALLVSEREAEIRIDDDGFGFSTGGDDGNDGLGLRIVRTLASQIDGHFECSATGNGTSCRVKFAVPRDAHEPDPPAAADARPDSSNSVRRGAGTTRSSS